MIRNRLPKEFAGEYMRRQANLETAIEDIKSTLSRHISQLNAQKGTRCRLVEARVKRPAKLWKKAQAHGFTIEDSFTNIVDLLGIRIVCNNLQDIQLLVEMINTGFHRLTEIDIRNMINAPTESGYRAVHVRAKYVSEPDEVRIPCEIQIRTLAQDAWARLSREDLYGNTVPTPISKLAQALSKQLAGIDDIAQMIRDELTKVPAVATEIKDSDTITPDRLALLFKDKYNDIIYEWSLLTWGRHLKDAEIATVGEVRDLLNDDEMRKKVNRVANEIRRYDLDDSEWAVLSGLVATGMTVRRGINLAKQSLQSEWNEIVATARGEALSAMPETFDEFVEMLENGNAPLEALRELGGVVSCSRCGTDVISISATAEAVLEYYENPDTDIDLEATLWGSGMAEIESVDYSGDCQYCGYQMSKDD